MPSVEDNLAQWDAEYGWEGAGDEWSGDWGGTESMWWGTLMPRVHAMLPAGTVLELAPGFGRWTQYLKDVAGELIVVDMAERCIEACRARFASSSNIAYHVNDGRSLDMVPDGSVDTVFSFDSLVHAEADVIEAYLDQLARKLAPEGVGFVHHSNMAHYVRAARVARALPERLRLPLVIRGALVNVYGWRAESMSAELFAELCRRAGLVCVSQERMNWVFGRHLTDCLSVFARPGSRWDRGAPRSVVNRDFRREGRHLTRLAPLYSQW
jgi:ubiquinone/menaquinone biosynthesis C-methylase UbiE